MTDRPNIGGNRLEVGLWQVHPSHRRHCARMFLGLRHASFYRFLDALEAPITPQPSAGGEIGPDRRADGVGAVAPGTRCAARLAMEDPLAEGYLFTCSGVDPGGVGRLAAAVPASG